MIMVSGVQITVLGIIKNEGVSWMKLLNFHLENDHNIFFFGDKHEGSVLSSNSAWGLLIESIKSKYDGCRNNYAVEGGDDIEAITIDDKRFSKEMLTEDLPLAQMRRAIELRRPIQERYLWKLMGNHDGKLWRIGNIMEGICNELGVQYGTYTAKGTILDKKDKLMYKIFNMHGSRSITSSADDIKRRKSNMELILKRQLREKTGDCAVMIKHHAHKLLVCNPERTLYLTDDGENITQNYTGWGENESYIHPDARWYGCAGSFLRLYGKGISGYAEIAEYDPVELGYLVLKVRDRKIVSLDKVALNV